MFDFFDVLWWVISIIGGGVWGYRGLSNRIAERERRVYKYVRLLYVVTGLLWIALALKFISGLVVLPIALIILIAVLYWPKQPKG
jgi:hypothetical protein